MEIQIVKPINMDNVVVVIREREDFYVCMRVLLTTPWKIDVISIS